MVFSSVPLYLDPPNWQQHQNQQQQQQQQLQGNNGTGNHHEINQHRLNIPALPPPPAVQQVGLGGNGPGPARPNSMAERARLAKIPPPEAPLKCPRCDSTNTKFCYFNNYSLTQPRHFCKTCRRYWTRGGALRNVPVGGGCRRNKRSSSSSGAAKSSTSSASTTTSSATTKPSSSLSGMGPAGGGGAGFMASLQSIAQLGMGSLGLNFPGPTALHSSNPTGGLLDQLDHYGASINTSSNINALLSHHHHQVSSFPNFLGGFEIPGSNSFQNVVVGGDDNGDDQVGGKGMTSSLTNISGLMGAGVKMENSSHTEKGLLMGMNSTTSSLQMNVTSSMTTMNDSNNNNHNNNSQFWGATGGGGDTGSTSLWTTAAASHLAGLNSSSTTTTSHLL